MVNQQKSAMQVAEFLQRQPKVQRVVYPGLANFGAARTGAPSDDHAGRVFRARPHAVF
jgi:cystathionine beta-lyase/cystathionine gamma-synthase